MLSNIMLLSNLMLRKLTYETVSYSSGALIYYTSHIFVNNSL